MYISLDNTKATLELCDYIDDITEEEYEQFEKTVNSLFNQSKMTVGEIRNALRINGFGLREATVSPMFNHNSDKYPWLELHLSLTDKDKRNCYVTFRLHSWLDVTV